ncbi:hypothetical protein POPTR_008G136800v4 [Populus trichocarpa]|uniref:HSF-type DNA-binding domain-containing protein n=1 Tax=Populus trichocarpa TaxID=3694 RepID=B9HJI4_POPTR|nr:heat stress transcription factor A-8 [Populus trichocarpa]XP_024463668.1 heat stress transcription factor A-8 [Populus trichocarpa]KAI5579967.1 hypothetical protein BDE02_08G124700 [Populus trichocarpa]PNT24491.1 hypothetical protein POPTR_008G136800v4 [Populus trichocarpa]|eukprot:XP_002311537.1 heat stress transcription factor A-8 isoform X1 [Populus trichocarpa]
MVKSSDSGVAPFLKKCYEMVGDESTNSIISWSQTNDSFVIWDMTEFCVHLLPKYFKHSNSSSFVRQLNIYGFRKIDTDHWEFANDGFIRGQKHLLKNISRRKNSQGTDNRKLVQQQDNSVEHHESVENAGLWKEVENLKTGKIALTQELVKLSQHQETADNKLLLLRDRLQGMEKNQQQMLSFLVMAMQKSPGFLAQLLHKKENNWRMAEPGSIVEQVADDADPLASEGMIVKYQPPVDETFEPMHAPPIGPENPRESNPSSDGMKDFFFSSEFTELLMDENLGFENHAPFVLPELADDGAWEQLLLANPFVANIKDSETDYEEPTDAETDTGTAVPGTQLDRSQDFENLIEQMEKYHNLENQATDEGPHFEKPRNLEILTKQMGLLASETNH